MAFVDEFEALRYCEQQFCLLENIEQVKIT